MQTAALTPRWTPLEFHPEQSRLYHEEGRFKVAAAGRRSGKTELAKRKLVEEALSFTAFPNGRFIAGAPTRDQAKRIYWDDLKALTPSWAIRKIYDGELKIQLINGARIEVVGFDKPMRAEGDAIDGAILDEIADMKPEVWSMTMRPSLATRGRPGWCWFIGKPRGRNHYFDLWNQATVDETGTWKAYHWTSEDILDAAEIEALKADMDDLTYQQEVLANFVNFEGRAYYPFERGLHAAERLKRRKRQPLIFCFDFNVSPGTATVLQEQRYRGTRKDIVADIFTACIGEVWIPRNSNTNIVCDRLIHDWAKHEGLVYCYGDATGGARGSAKVEGSDWELIERKLRPIFRERLQFRVPKANPSERVRINSVNSRLKTSDGRIHFLVDPVACPQTVLDFEGTTVIAGGSGELDKKADPNRTHLTDGIGYYIHKEFPMVKHKTVVMQW